MKEKHTTPGRIGKVKEFVKRRRIKRENGEQGKGLKKKSN